ncbi:ABC transporter substrate-binding protein [Endozoicomonas numazuensis]|uniref:Peptide ABC transporter substrate-binding protein n=1 Tax=Endozoicomonas numazuensis TaxID=1137799 RepID=A0A081NGR6_9GAMM|nr:ABC transporter substrate-binding protein [Endozoicomonas numazuensis]KEQ17639.1 peptide ABC transporter substrate-binding protein [Endozoicomonas numazuensis]
MNRKATRYLAATLTAATLLTGCSGPWNDPNPPTDPEINTYFGSFINRPKHLDPVRSYSAEEGLFLDQIYEPPLQYHFLKRPYELQPATAEKLPEITFLNDQLESVSDSETPAYSLVTIKLKPNTLYQPHPAFAKDQEGNPLYLFSTPAESAPYILLQDFPVTDTRTLKADDYIYQIKRMGDPINKSPLIGLMSDYIVGMKAFGQTVKEARQEDQWLDLRDFEMEGLQKVDDLTFTIRIKGSYPQFQYWLAMRFFAPVPFEADRFYHNPGFEKKNLTLDWNPIGTGPFMMTRNSPNREIILEKNPNYRDDFYPTEGSENDVERGYLADAGKKLPFIDKAIFRYEKAATSQWSKFTQGYYDRSGDGHSNINTATFDQAFTVGPDGLELTKELEGRDIVVDEEVRPSIFYTGFNMLDPVVGGYTEDKRKLRQAISIIFNDQEYIDIFVNGLGQIAHGPIPPGLFGYRPGAEGMNPFVFDWDEKTNSAVRKPIEEARKLLAEAGYPNGRHAETGEPLILYLDTTAKDTSPNLDWMKKQFARLNIQLEFRTTDYPRFKEKMRQGNTQIFRWGWLADYPDPENFLFLLDSRQGLVKCACDGSNSSNYDSPEFDRLYDQVKSLPNGPARQAAIDQMVEIVQKDSPWIWGFNQKDYYLSNHWVFNTKRHGISQGTLKYVRLDEQIRAEKQVAWNSPNVIPLLGSIGLLLALIIPGIGAYRRRQKLTIETE